MAKKKLTELELNVKHNILPQIDYSYQKSVSYSQFSTYQTCPHQWYLSYVKNLNPYSDSIHTIFGTTIHEVLQHYITVMYNKSGAAADREDLELMFQEKFTELYKEAYNKTKNHFSSAEQMREFYDDGIAIIQHVRKKRNLIFSLKNTKLLGIELPIIIKVDNNLYLKGYIDVVFYNPAINKVTIIDFKSSTRGWNDKQKKDDNKIAQILLYKEFFSKQYNVDVDNIDVEYLILKRKIWEESEFPQSRIQSFKPASGKIKRAQVMEKFNKFIKDCFNNGVPIEKQYYKNVEENSCKWCPYNNTEFCNKEN